MTNPTDVPADDEDGKISPTNSVNDVKEYLRAMAGRDLSNAPNEVLKQLAKQRLLYLIGDGPPDAEEPDDFDDERYHLYQAYATNTDADAVDAKLKLGRVPYDPEDALTYLVATNIAERPRDFDGTLTVKGSHHLRKGLLVAVYPVTDQSGGIRYEFCYTPKPFIARIADTDTAAGIYVLDLLKGAPDLESIDSGGATTESIGELGDSDGRGICLADIDTDGWSAPVGSFVVAHSAGVYDGKGYFFFDVARAANQIFVARLNQVGGDAGDDNTVCDFTYDILSDDGATVLIEDRSPLRPRFHAGEMTAATKGYVYHAPDGTLLLAEAWEHMGSESCPEPE
jgi:hypothetical protein